MAQQWAKQFYNSRQWKDCRRYVLRRDSYTCKYCYNRATEVHHVVELTPDNINDIHIALNPNNLLSLCHKCHTNITQGYGDVEDGYVFSDDGQVIRA